MGGQEGWAEGGARHKPQLTRALLWAVEMARAGPPVQLLLLMGSQSDSQEFTWL